MIHKNEEKVIKTPAVNKHLGEIGGRSDSPNFGASFNRRCQSELCAVEPQLHQVAEMLSTSSGQRSAIWRLKDSALRTTIAKFEKMNDKNVIIYDKKSTV